MFTEDVAKAQSLLAEAGYPGGAGFPVVNIVCQNNDEQKLMAQILGAMWKTNLGVQYTITTYESSTYWDELANGNFSVGRNGFTTDYMDPSVQPEGLGERLQLLRERLGRSGVRHDGCRREHDPRPSPARSRVDRGGEVYLRADARHAEVHHGGRLPSSRPELKAS
jgi:hypothetical protein